MWFCVLYVCFQGRAVFLYCLGFFFIGMWPFVELFVSFVWFMRGVEFFVELHVVDRKNGSAKKKKRKKYEKNKRKKKRKK